MVSFIVYITLIITVPITWSDTLTADDLKLFPEPRLATFLFGDYEFDKNMTTNYYNQLFLGKNAVQTIGFLKREGFKIFYKSEDTLSFLVAHKVVFFDYSVFIDLKFKEGTFDKANVHGWGVK